MIDVTDLIGIPYKCHGRDEAGLDCFGLILIIAYRAGTILPDVWYERSDPALISLAEKMNVHKIKQNIPGCIIEMENKGRLHLGYALDERRMIHATLDGVCVDDIGRYPVKGYYAFGKE